MKHLSGLTLALSVLLLTGCTFLTPSPGPTYVPEPTSPGTTTPPTRYDRDIEPPKQAREAFRLHGTGFQFFRCVSDRKGLYWRFVVPQADLRNDAGQVLVTHGADFMFHAKDGSQLKGSIIASAPGASSRDLKTVIFRTQSMGSHGRLSDVHWVKRVDAQGGVPQTTCSASQNGRALRVPFKADYIFYR